MRGRCLVLTGLQAVYRAVINPLLCVYKYLVVWLQTACTTFVAMLLFVCLKEVLAKPKMGRGAGCCPLACLIRPSRPF